MMPSASDADIDTMIRDFFRAWERQDADHVASCFTEDAIYHNIPMEPLVGIVAIREFLDQPAKVTHPVPVAVAKRFDVRLVDDCVFVPQRIHARWSLLLRHAFNF